MSRADPSELQAQVAERWELASEETQRRLEQTLAVAFLGSASSGKDAAIRALFGIDFGQVDPIPGSTERARVAPVDAERRLMVINAPGFGDLRQEVKERAEEVLDQLDLAVYLVNADGGATIDERTDLDRIRALGKPTLVCINKIDLIRRDDLDAFVRATIVQLGVPDDMVVLTAFDPLPALSEDPIGVDRVIAWIHQALWDDGKALLFAKNLRNKAAAAEPVIQRAAQRAAMAGAIPIPGADATAVTAIQVAMITELAAIYGRVIDQQVVLFIITEALAGSTRGFVGWAVKALKTAGWIPGGQALTVATSALGASIAAAATYGIGKAAIAFLGTEGSVSGDQLRDVFDAEAQRYQDESDP